MKTITRFIKPMKTNARFIKDIDSNRKLWQMPDGVYIQTSFSDKVVASYETAAFYANAEGEVVDWLDLVVAFSSEPAHEYVIEKVLKKYNRLGLTK